MSSRGGGRRSERRRNRPSPASVNQPSQGSGTGRGRGGTGAILSTPSVSASSSRQPPAAHSVPSHTVSETVTSLATDVETRLTMQTGATVNILPPTSSKALRNPVRPGYGTIGRKCVVRANHFLVDVAQRDLHQYDVSITPEVISRKVNRDIMLQLVNLYGASHLGRRRPAYDGRKSLYTAGALPFISMEFVVQLSDKDPSDGSSGPTRRGREFKVAIKFASKPDLYHLQQFLSRRQLDSPQETIQALDVVLRAKPSQDYTVVGSSFFSTNLGAGGSFGDGIEYWRGYYQSLRPTQMGLSINIDVSATPFYEAILVNEFISKSLNIGNLNQPLSDRDGTKVKKALRGLKVELINNKNRRRYKITGISSLPPSQLMFTLDDNITRLSVAQYFCERYNAVLKHPSLPALQAGSDTKPIYLPMEFCRIVEGQRYTKKLNEDQVRKILRATCQRPHEREASIKQMVKRNDFKSNELVAEEFGIKVNEEPTVVDARILPAPLLKYHDSGKEVTESPRMGQWNMINKKMFNGAKVQYWACVCFSTRFRNVLNDFCHELVNMCNSKGLDFNKNPLLPFSHARSDRIPQTLIDIHKQSMKVLGPDNKLQLLVIILPEASGSYGKIKRICETELGIVSQCCKPQIASKIQKQYLENLTLKINVKVGGRNTVLNDAMLNRIPLVSDRPTIIIGADVTHPQPGENSSPSIAAVVASMDWPLITKYRALVSLQPPRVEIIQDLYKLTADPKRGSVHGGMIRELFIAFRRETGWKPDRIIFYRDGVSEGQFSQVLLYEMDAIRKACASLEEGYLPGVTFVVVQKRHHTRLFATDRAMTDKSGNIQPGTVVDTKICHPTEFDFYLNSHAGIQGTSRPAHYHVLLDENRFSADVLQMLTNSLCYTYARCTRSVSIVPPAYYAHLAAFRARYYMEDELTDGGSSSGRSGNVVAARALPPIKESVKDVMFYC